MNIRIRPLLPCLAGILTMMGVHAPSAAETPDAPVAPYQETVPAHNARMQWFRDAKFGMFIHWGLYSQLAGEWQGQTVTGGAEWIQNYLKIPSSQYGTLVKTWNPTKYDARDWVRLMKAAGIKYVCITTKHHDGFCLWPTKMNDDWNITLTPGGKDLIKPLADACQAEGLQFCIYHSVMDWHHPDWPNRPSFNDDATGQPDKARFRKYLYGELQELFANYGPIGMVWFDGTWDRQSWSSEDGKALEDYTRSLQPSVILDNRSGYLPPQRKLNIEVANSYGYTFAGDYISPEGEVPSTGLPGIDWETCQTMQLPNNWGYNRLVGFRPFKDLLQQLVDVTSKGGNMLLNIGPTAEGEILPQARQCLEKFGAWMSVNGEAIHGTTASPFASLPFDGRCTQKPGVLYLHVFTRPQNGKLLVPARNKVKRAWLLGAARHEELNTAATVGGIEISVPATGPDPIDSVVAVEIAGMPAVIAPAKPVSQGRPVTVSAEWAGRPALQKEHINDGRFDTIWAGPENSREGWVRLDLGEDHSVARAVISEGPDYARCSKFTIQAQIGGQWKTVVTGTGIGTKKNLFFEPVKARYFRLSVTVDKPAGLPDAEPVIGEFQLFDQ